MDEHLFGELIVQDNFEDTLKEIRERKVEVPNFSSEVKNNYANFSFPRDGGKIKVLENSIHSIPLNSHNGCNYYNSHRIAAYDESIEKYSCLEGDLYVTAHSIVQLTEEEYFPIGYVAANFYTKAKKWAEQTKTIRYADKLAMRAQIDYAKDKINLMRNKVIDGSTLFIDGPIIGGDVYTYMIKLLSEFVEKGTIPVFFVKNSSSDMVTDSFKELNGNFNSDLHWASCLLKKGERSNFFSYEDKHNSKNAKVFCYCRLFNGSPQRVEFYADSFYKNIENINSIMDCIYYMAILQGLDKNPQIRPIVVAEKYAREYIKLCDVKETFIKLSSTIPTVNEERFKR